MSKRSQIVLLIAVVVVLLAATLSITIPGDSPLKTASILIIAVIGASSALVQFTGTEVFLKLFRESLSRPKRVSSEQLLDRFVSQHLLVRCEAVGRRPVYQLDDDYWTNLTLNFSRLVNEPDILDLCARCVRTLLPTKSAGVLVVEPLDIGMSQVDTRQVVAEIVDRLQGRFVRANETRGDQEAVIIAGVFLPQIRQFLFRQGHYITDAVFLIGPDSHYFTATFQELPTRLVSVVSADSLKGLDPKSLLNLTMLD